MKYLTQRNIITVVAIAILMAFVYLFLSVGTPETTTQTPLLVSETDIIWRGDAETGDLSQWCNINQAQPGRISVVTNPVTQGKYAYRFQLNDGDSVFGTERVTMSQQCPGRYELEGQDKYFSLSFMLPPDYIFSDDWGLVAQWKGIHTGSPPISLNLRNGRWLLNYRPTVNDSEIHKWDTAAIRGQWTNIILHVKWSADPKTGFIEMWYNGVLVVPKFYTATMHITGSTVISNYFVIGLYRDSNIKTNAVLFHDGVIVGKTFLSVTSNLPPITSLPPTNISTPVAPTITRTVAVTRTPTTSRTPTRTLIAPSVTATWTLIPPSVPPVLSVTPTLWCPIDPSGETFICIRPIK